MASAGMAGDEAAFRHMAAGGGAGARAGTEPAAVAFHALCVVASLGIAGSTFDGSRFGYHPTFMATGYVLLMAEGAYAAVKFRTADGPDRVSLIWRHAAIQGAGVLCACIGFYAIYTNKTLHGKPHFTSYHSYAGLAAFVLALVAPLGGLVSFKRLGMLTKLPQSYWAPVKLAHRKAGSATVFVALLAVLLTLTHKAVYLVRAAFAARRQRRPGSANDATHPAVPPTVRATRAPRRTCSSSPSPALACFWVIPWCSPPLSPCLSTPRARADRRCARPRPNPPPPLRAVRRPSVLARLSVLGAPRAAPSSHTPSPPLDMR